mgnify:CR=1 FL=1
MCGGVEHYFGLPAPENGLDGDGAVGRDLLGDLQRLGERLALGAQGAEEDRHVDRAGWHELRELHHLHGLAVDLDDLESLSDLIIAAVRDAGTQAANQAQALMPDLGGLGF